MDENLLAKIRGNPLKWIPAVLPTAMEKLLEHRIMEWTNHKIDERVGFVSDYIAPAVQLSGNHIVLSFFVIVAMYAIGVVGYAHISVLVGNRKGRPVLEYVTWHAGGTRSLPNIELGVPMWVEIRNKVSGIPETARNVTASLEFQNEAGTIKLNVPEVAWHRVVKAGEVVASGWAASVDLESGDEQSFIFFVTDSEDKKWAIKGVGLIPVGVLDNAHWITKLRVSSDNAKGFEGTVDFITSKHSFDGSKGFTRRRTVPPRLRSA